MVAHAVPAAAMRADHRVVVVAASMGGLAALSSVLAGLPPMLAAAVIVVQHLAAAPPSRLDEVLSANCALSVGHARSGETPAPGRVFVAPVGRHLLIDAAGTFALADTAPVCFVRPSANVLFESAAAFYRSGTVAVVLTGRGDDGSLGVRAVRRAGGTVIVQDEASSAAFGMPGAAIASGCADFVLPLGLIAPKIRSLVGDSARAQGAAGA